MASAASVAFAGFKGVGGRGTRRASLGFSIVEMLVALMFTALLMGGLASVFKASLPSLYTSGEKLSSIRRNRIATDLLYDDINNAGLAMVDLTQPLAETATNPGFYIIPNVAVSGTPGPLDPTKTDELYMAFDQPLAFDGTLTSGGGALLGKTAENAVLTGTTLTVGTDDTYVVDCGDSAYAKSVKAGMYMQIKDDMSHAALQILTAAPTGLTSVTMTVVTTLPVATQVTGRGDSGALRPTQRIPGSSVVFVLPAQMVQYHIAMLNLDPVNTNGIPCLVRNQGNYTLGVHYEY